MAYYIDQGRIKESYMKIPYGRDSIGTEHLKATCILTVLTSLNYRKFSIYPVIIAAT